jgi:hypothetical protein
MRVTTSKCAVIKNEKYAAAVALLYKMLRFEADRISLDEVMEHPFFTTSLPPGTEMMGKRARESEDAFQEQNALELRQFEERVQASMQPEPATAAHACLMDSATVS